MYQVIERTGNSIAKDQRANTLYNIQSRVMALMHDTSSEYALQMYEVSLNYLYQLHVSSYRAEEK